MQYLSVRGVIYFYIFICVVLLIYNLLYIFGADNIKNRQQRRRQNWFKYIEDMGYDLVSEHERSRLMRKLGSISELMAFHDALEQYKLRNPDGAGTFFSNDRALFLELAEHYGKRPAMEQAFFAYVIADICPAVGDKSEPMIEYLLSFFDNSTVFSRENILSALYAFGNVQAIDHAFTIMSRNDWYHDHRLLSDGLSRFRGSKQALARRLWDRRDNYLECFQVGTVRFADTLPGDGFAREFLKALENEPLPLETRFTIVRCFRRHNIPEAKPVLLRMLRSDEGAERELAIAAAMVLEAYPDDETRTALKVALGSSNWYVRQNAARSLKALGITASEAAEILSGGDRYAAEMLEYITGYKAPGAADGNESEAAVTV